MEICPFIIHVNLGGFLKFFLLKKMMRSIVWKTKGVSFFLPQLPMKSNYSMTRSAKSGMVELLCKLKINTNMI